MKKMVVGCVLVALLTFCPRAAHSQSEEERCPDGSVEMWREPLNKDTVRLHCWPIGKLTSAQLGKITDKARNSLSPEDRRDLEQTAKIAAIASDLEPIRGDIPMTLLLGWIAKESSWNFAAAPTERGERGFFQVDPSEWCPAHNIVPRTCAEKWRWDSDAMSFTDPAIQASFEKLSTDRDYSLQWGVKVAKTEAGEVRRRVDLDCDAASDSCSFWHFIKLVHAISAGTVEKLSVRMQSDGVDINSWAAVTSYVQQQGTPRLIQLVGDRQDYVRWVNDVSDVFSTGADLNTRFGQPAK